MKTKRDYLSLSERLYALLLVAYPAEFRCEYGRQMMQLFRDCYRAEVRRKGLVGIVSVWADTLFDLCRTVPQEHLRDSSGKLRRIMKALRTLALAVIVYVAALLLLGRLLVAARPYLPFAIGALFDSLLTVGIAFNFIALLLVTTRLVRPVRAIRAACASVVLLLAAFLLFIPSVDRPGGVALTAMVLSLLFWFGAHQWWAQRREQAAT